MVWERTNIQHIPSPQNIGTNVTFQKSMVSPDSLYLVWKELARAGGSIERVEKAQVNSAIAIIGDGSLEVADFSKKRRSRVG